MPITKKSNKTAVQVIIDFINENAVFKKSNELLVKSFDDLLTEAALLEKQQIEFAFSEGFGCSCFSIDKSAEQYYLENYK